MFPVNIKKYYLILAFCSVAVIALLYGVAPQLFLATFFDTEKRAIDLAHVLRALMGLYLALGLFWLYAAFDARYRNAAILTTALFSGGLVAGRLLSLVLDGRPSSLLMFYVVLELAFLPVSIWVLRRPD